MSFQSRQASRGMVKPLIAFYSESGGGKSFSALLMARGLVGPKGNIQLIDTEGGRGELYSDVVPGGYGVIPFSDPFSPNRYIEAISYAESLNPDAIIIDQLSSEWAGPGGVLDMAGENEDSGKRGLSVWKTPKLEHAKLIEKLMRSTCPVIVCLRAKYKNRQVKQNGKTEIVKDEHLSPVQDDEFIFETTVHGFMTQDHAFHPVKISHPSLGVCFPNGQPITIAHGEALAQWCRASGVVTPSAKTDDQELKTLKQHLWTITTGIHKGDKKVLQQWLYDEVLMDDTLTLSSVGVEDIQNVILKVNAKLNLQTVATK